MNPKETIDSCAFMITNHNSNDSTNNTDAIMCSNVKKIMRIIIIILMIQIMDNIDNKPHINNEKTKMIIVIIISQDRLINI